LSSTKKPTTKKTAPKKEKGEISPGKKKHIMSQAAIEAIYEAMRQGNYLNTAAACANVSRMTIWKWRTQGELDRKAGLDTKFSQFLDGMEAAEAEGEQALVKMIKIASEKEWTAAAWMLERKYPEKFGRKDRVKFSLGEDDSERDWDSEVLEELDGALLSPPKDN